MKPVSMARAHYLVYKAVRAGMLLRPNQCADCGKECFAEAAHHDYQRPLDVRWLCRSCHAVWDHAAPKGHTANPDAPAKATVSFGPGVLDRIKGLASSEHRSVSNMLSILVERGMASYVEPGESESVAV